jgi:hypothetical protein
MNTVYSLTIIDKELSYDNHTEAFQIGFFSSYEKAEKIAQKYMGEVPGFKDYNCCYRIALKPVIGDAKSLVYIIQGWNENDDFDAIDVIESNCFVQKTLAEQEIAQMKTEYQRKEWSIDCWKIDECNWQDGFSRV